MPDPRMNLEQKDSWSQFDPLDYDCDVEGCGAKAGTMCDPEKRGIHVDRGLDALIEIVQERKRNQGLDNT